MAAARDDRAVAARRARRAAIRRHHPDVGGSAEQLAAALDRIELHASPTVAATLTGRLRRRCTRLCALLPSRRYATISS